VPIVEAKLMLYYRFTGIHSSTDYLPLLAIIFMVTTNLFGLSSIPWIGVLGLMLFQFYILLYQACPPTVIFLATSLSESAAVRYRIDRGIHPYRVVALLDPSCEATSSLFYQNSLEWDNVRTTAAWEPVVYKLIDKSPRIVIDTRVPSPSVVHETQRV